MNANPASFAAIPDWLPVGTVPPAGMSGAPRLDSFEDHLDFYEANGFSLILLARSRSWMSLRTRKLAAKLPVSLLHYFCPRLSSYA